MVTKHQADLLKKQGLGNFPDQPRFSHQVIKQGDALWPWTLDFLYLSESHPAEGTLGFCHCVQNPLSLKGGFTCRGCRLHCALYSGRVCCCFPIKSEEQSFSFHTHLLQSREKMTYYSRRQWWKGRNFETSWTWFENLISDSFLILKDNTHPSCRVIMRTTDNACNALSMCSVWIRR